MTTSKAPEHKSVSTGAREPYETPKILFTEIQVEQALMGICKTSGTAGPFGPNCPGPCSGGS